MRAEDVLLGVWVAHLKAEAARARRQDGGALPSVASTAKDVHHLSLDLNDLADLHCGGNRNQLMSTVPRREQLLVHRLKTHGGAQYALFPVLLQR